MDDDSHRPHLRGQITRTAPLSSCVRATLILYVSGFWSNTKSIQPGYVIRQ